MSEIGGYSFRDEGLYRLALLPSGGRCGEDNERLEFLGDRVLGLVIASTLYERLPGCDEGSLSLRLARLVDREGLLSAGVVLGMEGRVITEGGEKEGRGYFSSVADSVEAMVAAIFLDGGWEEARSFVRRVWGEEIERICGEDLESMKDPKTRLQEYSQREYGELPIYRIVREEGSMHAKEFEVEVILRGGRLRGRGVGGSKRRAELESAKRVWEEMGEGT